MEEKIVKQFLSLATGSWHYPAYGINSKEMEGFTQNLLEEGYIESEDVQDALDDYPIQIFLAYLLLKKKISLKDFEELVKDTDYGTSCINYKEAYADIIKIGVKVGMK